MHLRPMWKKVLPYISKLPVVQMQIPINSATYEEGVKRDINKI